MCTIYTLRNALPNGHFLNGRVFIAKKIPEDNDNFHVEFLVLETGKVWLTTTVIQKLATNDGVIIQTKNTKYDLVRVETLIPTKAENTESNEPIVVSKVYDAKAIHYGDGYYKYTYEFDRDLTEDEFVAFCEKNGYKIIPEGPWYQDYSKVEGSGKIWTYTMINRYTD